MSGLISLFHPRSKMEDERAKMEQRKEWESRGYCYNLVFSRLFHFVVFQKWISLQEFIPTTEAQAMAEQSSEQPELWGGWLYTISWDCLFCTPMAFSISELHHNGSSDFAILFHILQHQWYQQEAEKRNLSSSYTEWLLEVFISRVTSLSSQMKPCQVCKISH